MGTGYQRTIFKWRIIRKMDWGNGKKIYFKSLQVLKFTNYFFINRHFQELYYMYILFFSCTFFLKKYAVRNFHIYIMKKFIWWNNWGKTGLLWITLTINFYEVLNSWGREGLKKWNFPTFGWVVGFWKSSFSPHTQINMV